MKKEISLDMFDIQVLQYLIKFRKWKYGATIKDIRKGCVVDKKLLNDLESRGLVISTEFNDLQNNKKTIRYKLTLKGVLEIQKELKI